MIEQTIQWLALPNGVAEDQSYLRLSVFVAPRLRSDEGVTLSPFPDFLDWPARLNADGVAFDVELADGTSIPATVVSEPPDSGLWTRFFGDETVLVPFEFDRFADRPIVSYSVRAVVDTLRTLYARVAAMSPGELPPMLPRQDQDPPVPGLTNVFGGLLDALRSGPLLEGVQDGDALDARIEDILEGARAESARRQAGRVPGASALEPLPENGSVARHFERVLLFHRRPGGPVDLPPDPDETAAQYEASLDFHRLLSALGDHPFLLRRLGLVVDLIVPGEAVPTGDDLAPVQLRVRPTWESLLAPGRSSDLLPFTACVHQEVGDEVFFGAADRNPNPMAPFQAPPTGLQALPLGAYALQQVDVDGAALKALNQAATLNRAANRAPGDTPLEEPDRTGLAALRTGSLALVHDKRAGSLQSEFGRAVALNDGTAAAAPATLYANDLVRGHRLDVFESRRGAWRSLHERTTTYAVDGQAAFPAQEDEGFFQLSVAAKAAPPATPPDPTGELYVHETMVSWDGWSLSVARPGKSLSADPRAPIDGEPATQPQRVSNEPLTKLGLSIESSVRPGTLPRLRFNDSYRVRLRTVDLAGNGPTVAEADRRLAMAETDTPVVPPNAEHPYLRFEPVPAPALVPREPYREGSSLLRLAIRSNAGVTAEAWAEQFGYQPYDDRHVAAPKAALEMVERHGMFDAVIGAGGAAPDDQQRAAIAAAYEVARREKGTLADLDPAEQIDLPYLPDPLAAGVVFTGLPGLAPGEPLVIRFDGAEWYDAPPFRLRFAEGDGAPQWDDPTRLLSVFLPQAADASVRVCSLLERSFQDMAVMRWCEETLGPDDLDRVYVAASENRCWLLTPWHDLRLVHAVQQPLAVPEYADFAVARDLNATFAHLFGIVAVHVASTEKIDLAAAWTETVDDLAQAGPEIRQGAQVVFSLPLKVAARYGAGNDPERVPYSLQDERMVSFQTRPREDLATLPVTPHQFGDTKYRRVRYRVVATTPFREYFPPEWKDMPERLTQTSADVEVDVPSSAPPAAPRVAYVMPTQGWEQEEADGTVTRRRRGGGLRVYLHRPWYSSGDGERLGVVIGGVTTPLASDYPFSTLIGQDPVRGGAPLEIAQAERFRNSAGVFTRVPLLERRGEQFNLHEIVTYEVAYDHGTGRWFADVEIDTEEAYFPFVRLALVRYQPHSLDGCFVSNVVPCDIAQTLPDRTLTVTRDADGLVIMVAGPSYASIAGPLGVRTDEAVRARFVASLEERDPDFADDVIGWRPVEGATVDLVPGPAGPSMTWTGRLSLPPPTDPGRRRRLAVHEFDLLAGDAETAGPDGLIPRIVYADVIEL